MKNGLQNARKSVTLVSEVLFMKKMKCQRHFYLLLVIFILLSGMCHDLDQADSVVAYAQNEENTSFIRVVRDKLADQDAYVEEETESSEFCHIVLQSKRGREEDGSFYSGEIFISPENLPGNSLLHTRKTDDGTSVKNQSIAVIVAYVHQQDGAKG